MVLANTGEAMDEKEKADLYIETMEHKFVAVTAWKNDSTGLAMSTCVVDIYVLWTSYFVLYF